MQPDIIPVILAGGQGRRLRPLTAPTRPKPFLKIFSQYSLFQTTLQRVSPFAAPVIACDVNFAGLARDEAAEMGILPHAILCEPVQRSTAAAIAAAAFLLQDQNPVMLVMPSDHLIDDAELFAETVCCAAELVTDGAPVILGKRPTGANTSYGYIQTHEENDAFLLDCFIEKPNAKMAQQLSRMKGMFWNTGIFLCRAQTLLKLLSQHAPEIFESAGHAIVNASRDDCFLYPDAARYARIPGLSIDHALMERLRAGVVLPLETGWHDVGCWERLLTQKLKIFTQRAKVPRNAGQQRKNSAAA